MSDGAKKGALGLVAMLGLIGVRSADMLELMVDKLARIVKNVMSSNMQNMIEQVCVCVCVHARPPVRDRP